MWFIDISDMVDNTIAALEAQKLGSIMAVI